MSAGIVLELSMANMAADVLTMPRYFDTDSFWEN